MRLWRLLPIVLFLAGCNPKWVEFKSPDGAFAVDFPRSPVMKASHTGTMWVAINDEVTYNIGTSTVPAQFAGDPKSSDKIFDEMQKALIGNNDPPRSTKSLSLGKDGHPGREVVTEKKNVHGILVVTGRAYRVNNNLYTMTVYAPASKARNPDITKFLESFRLIG
jgi:hypothetical protein